MAEQYSGVQTVGSDTDKRGTILMKRLSTLQKHRATGNIIGRKLLIMLFQGKLISQKNVLAVINVQNLFLMERLFMPLN